MLLCHSSCLNLFLYLEREIIRLDPANIAARNRLAALYFDEGRFDETITETDEILKAEPEQLRALTIQGLVYYRRGDADSALDRFQKVIDLGTSKKYGAFIQDVNNASYFAGVILLERGEYDKAVEDFRRSLVFDSADADAHAQLGRSLLALGQYEYALEELTIATRFMPGEAEFHYYRALVLEKMGNVEEAKQEAQRALGLKKNYTEASEALKRMAGK